MIPSTSDQPTLPRRGEKDFEHHGTLSQEDTLAASRAAMHNALSQQRVHMPKNTIVCLYDPETETTVVEHPKGPHFKTLGKSDSRSRLSLLPEEALYLVERGTLNLQWRTKDLRDIPMSLQTAYTYLIGSQGLTLERYTVYTSLKRNGYIIHRSPSWYPKDHDRDIIPPYSSPVPEPLGIFTQFYNLLFPARPPPAPPPQGPLVTPGLYRSYLPIYRQLALIPFHDPSLPSPRETPHPPPSSVPDHDRIRPCFHVWKPSTAFRKTARPPPDFRIAVINARDQSFPIYELWDDLLQSVPYDPPEAGSEGQVYKRVRQGWRSVVLAVVDQGVVSFVRVGDAGFGMEKVWDRRGGGGKRGNRTRGRGRGGGRGRGR